jgi:hypothetical protein
MRPETDLSEHPSSGDRGSSSSALSEGSAPQGNPRPRTKRVALLVLGALIGAVAGWQLLSLDADSRGGSLPDGGSDGESPSAVDTRAFEAHGVSFTYPAELDHLEGGELERLEVPIYKSLSLEEPVWKEVFALDENGLVAVYPYPEPFVMTSENVDEYARSVVGWKPSGFERPVVSDSVLQGLPMVHLAGGEIPTQSGTRIRIDVTTVYSGAMSYTVECFFTASTSLQIRGACTDIIESLRVPGSSSAGWQVLASGDDSIHVSVPPLWIEESSHPASVTLAAKLQPLSSPAPLVSLWITLHPASFFTQSETPEAMAAALFQYSMPRMELTDQRSVRLPLGMAYMVTLKSDSRWVTGYVVIKGQSAAIVSFTFSPDRMRLLRPTIDAVVRTLTLD